MRIVHTSDWHVGRRWKTADRRKEMAAVIRYLGDYIEREKIDLVLHTGDLFDGRNPDGEAEDLVNLFFVRMSELGVPTVVIAGNHDDPERFDARGRLAKFAGVRLIGRSRSAGKGGTFTLETGRGEKAMVAALPFASPGRWLNALQLGGDETQARGKYAEAFQWAVENLCEPFRDDTVRLLMAHTHVHGAFLAGSERRVHIGEEWAATPQTLSTKANYIALGHIHRPQRVEGMLPAYYAGSPMQMDFGEVGQEKTFVSVTAFPGTPAKVEHIPYEGAWPLVDLRGTLEQLAAMAAEHRDGAWLRVFASTPKPEPDLNRKVREMFPRAVAVIPVLPESAERQAEATDARATPRERYSAFHRGQYNEDPTAEVLEEFDDLHASESGSEA
jgi:exonuclease SbcD